jgi:hypothetical protein
MLFKIMKVLGKFEKDKVLNILSGKNKIGPNHGDSNKNLPVTYSEVNGDSNKNLPVACADEIQISTVYNEFNEIRYFVLTNKIQAKITPISSSFSLFFVIDTFEDTIIEKFKLCFENLTSLSLLIITFPSNSLKKVIYKDQLELKIFKLIEINAIFHDQALDEVTVSGPDINSKENIMTLLSEGEINKVVLSFDYPISPVFTISVSPLIKIYADGRISIIPELEAEQVMIILLFLLNKFDYP